MKQVLVIGSTVTDVIIHLDHLPRTSEDVHVIRQTMSLGGCAYNVSDMIRHFQVPYTLFSPVGTGVYGHFVREALSRKGVKSPIPTPEQENGCCYCFVEASGERTFVCHRGAEYRFRPDGLICWIRMPLTVSTSADWRLKRAPGRISSGSWKSIRSFRYILLRDQESRSFLRIFCHGSFALSPILHLNETEAREYTRRQTAKEAAQILYAKTGNAVIITLGDRGACCKTAEKTAYIPGVKAKQTDTIGAGDSHIGAVIARLKQGATMEEAVADANRVAAAVVGTSGALLSDEAFLRLGV